MFSALVDILFCLALLEVTYIVVETLYNYVLAYVQIVPTYIYVFSARRNSFALCSVLLYCMIGIIDHFNEIIPQEGLL